MRITILFLLFTITGCASLMEWYNPNKSESEFYTDRNKCIQQAASMYPTLIIQQRLNNGYQAPTMTNCSSDGNRNMTCISTPGSYTPPATMMIDANAEYRKQAFNSCMNSDGWTLRFKNK